MHMKFRHQLNIWGCYQRLGFQVLYTIVDSINQFLALINIFKDKTVGILMSSGMLRNMMAHYFLPRKGLKPSNGNL